jgi:hypothetical protein
MLDRLDRVALVGHLVRGSVVTGAFLAGVGHVRLR